MVDAATITVDTPTSAVWTLLGVGGDDLHPVGFDLRDPGPTGGAGVAATVAGPPGSGRSTALHTAARWWLDHNVQIVLVTPRTSRLTELSGRPGVLAALGVHDPGDAETLETVLTRARENGSPARVIVDDAELLLDSPVETELRELLKRAPRTGEALMLGGSGRELSAQFRGVALEARRSRLGLLLCPEGPGDGDLFGIQVRRGEPPLPGRGLLVCRGTTQPVQVAVRS